MKTPMQEFLEWLENSSNVKNDILNWQIVKENALEKEKEQSINLIKQTCMFMGASIIDVEISKMEFEDIYNNYYDINK